MKQFNVHEAKTQFSAILTMVIPRKPSRTLEEHSGEAPSKAANTATIISSADLVDEAQSFGTGAPHRWGYKIGHQPDVNG
jgi:hypothetical protein